MLQNYSIVLIHYTDAVTRTAEVTKLKAVPSTELPQAAKSEDYFSHTDVTTRSSQAESCPSTRNYRSSQSCPQYKRLEVEATKQKAALSTRLEAAKHKAALSTRDKKNQPSRNLPSVYRSSQAKSCPQYKRLRKQPSRKLPSIQETIEAAKQKAAPVQVTIEAAKQKAVLATRLSRRSQAETCPQYKRLEAAK